MFHIGCHLSSTKGFLAMGREALGIGANTFAFFTRNPRGGKAKEMDPEDAASLLDLMREHSFGTLVAHAPYTLNCCAAEDRVREFAHLCMQEDLARMEYTPGQPCRTGNGNRDRKNSRDSELDPDGFPDDNGPD